MPIVSRLQAISRKAFSKRFQVVRSIGAALFALVCWQLYGSALNPAQAKDYLAGAPLSQSQRPYLTLDFPSSVVYGMPNTATVTALDNTGKIVTSYSGTVHIQVGSTQDTVSADAKLIDGVGKFSVTFKVLGLDMISAVDTANPAINSHPYSVIVTVPPVNCAQAVQVTEAECKTLVAVYDSTYNNTPDPSGFHQGWTIATNWHLNNRPCTWYGVSCKGGHVIALDLSVNNLDGVLPSLNALTSLLSLNLNSNNLSGAIPALNALTNLRTIDLSNNKFSGSIPALSGLSNLQNLSLRINQLTGSIPALDSLRSLQIMLMDRNQLTGSLPALSGLHNLLMLDLSNNQLSGTIPSLNGLYKLQTLNFGGNKFSGVIPSLSGLSNLQSVTLAFNQFTGSVPDLPTSITFLDVSNNSLNGIIPDSLAHTSIPAGFAQINLQLCGMGNILTPANANVNAFIAARLPGWTGSCGSTTTATFTSTAVPTQITLTVTPSATRPMPSPTPQTLTPTNTPTFTPTNTFTPTHLTFTPSSTFTPTHPTVTATPTFTPSATRTNSPTSVSSATPNLTSTRIPPATLPGGPGD